MRLRWLRRANGSHRVINRAKFLRNHLMVVETVESKLPPVKTLLPPDYLQLLFIVLPILDVFFQFVNLHRKIYLQSCFFKGLQRSGFSVQDLLFRGSKPTLIKAEYCSKYQCSHFRGGLIAFVKYLVVNNSQPSPQNFLFKRFGDVVLEVH